MAGTMDVGWEAGASPGPAGDPAVVAPAADFTSWLAGDVRPRLVAFARRLVGDGDAEDLAQEAFFRAGTHLGRLRAEARAEAWIFRICRHAAIDHLRTRRVRNPVWAPMPEDVADWAPERPAAPRPARIAWNLLASVAALLAHQHLLLHLHHVHGLSQARLCHRTGLSAPALRVRLFRARRSAQRVSAGGAPALGLA